MGRSKPDDQTSTKLSTRRENSDKQVLPNLQKNRAQQQRVLRMHIKRRSGKRFVLLQLRPEFGLFREKGLQNLQNLKNSKRNKRGGVTSTKELTYSTRNNFKRHK